MLHNHFFHPVGVNNSFSFLKDILPVLISGLALIFSVCIPYLLIRYEKVYNLNREYRIFLRQIELYLLEWLNVTGVNSRTSEEFLATLNEPKNLFTKSFMYYEYPETESFTGYNIELINEFYVLMRKVKNLNHLLKSIDREYDTLKSNVMSGGKIPENSSDFFIKAINDLKDGYPKFINELTDLRLKVRLLLKQTDKVDSLQVNRFFSFGLGSRLWYKNDLQFSHEDLDLERSILEKEKVEGSKQSEQ